MTTMRIGQTRRYLSTTSGLGPVVVEVARYGEAHYAIRATVAGIVEVGSAAADEATADVIARGLARLYAREHQPAGCIGAGVRFLWVGSPPIVETWGR